MSTTTLNQKPKIHAVDLFCGAGGLTCGLKQAGIGVMAGVDVETRCEFAYSHNNQETGVSYGALADALAGRAPLSMSDLLYAGLGLPERLEELLFLGGMPHRIFEAMPRCGRFLKKPTGHLMPIGSSRESERIRIRAPHPLARGEKGARRMSLVCGTIFLEVGSQQAVHVGGQGDKDVLDANVPVFRIGGEERVMQRMACDVDPVMGISSLVYPRWGGSA